MKPNENITITVKAKHLNRVLWAAKYHLDNTYDDATESKEAEKAWSKTKKSFDIVSMAAHKAERQHKHTEESQDIPAPIQAIINAMFEQGLEPASIVKVKIQNPAADTEQSDTDNQAV